MTPPSPERSLPRRISARGVSSSLSLISLFVAVLVGSDVLAVIGAALALLIARTGPGLGSHLALATSFALTRALGFTDGLVEPALTLIAGSGYVTVHPSLLFPPTVLALLTLTVCGRWRAFIPLLTSCALACVVIGVLQWMGQQKAELTVVGYLLFLAALAHITLSGWGVWRERNSAVTRAGVLVLIAVALSAFAARAPGVTETGERRVSVWWPSTPSPEFGSTQDGVGWANIGQFGELPKLLRHAGYEVTTVDSLDLVTDPIVILPAPFRYLNANETAHLRRHVTDGAHLLMIGEHTNLGGVQETFNSILAGTGIGLNFDTTNGLFGDSSFSLSGPMVAGNDLLTHNRGASIRVSGVHAQVLLRGSWWHSDVGDRLAPENAFLSDYRLSPADRLGSIVLAARVPMGSGSIIVWGDSSPFLNQNLAFNSRFELTLLKLLAAEPRSRWLAFALGLGVATVGLLIWRLYRRPEIPWVLFAALVLVPPSQIPQAALPHPLAVISTHENNAFDHDPFSPKGVTGLGVWATRSGIVPWVGDWTALGDVPESLFIINPHITVTTTYVNRLRALMDAGTTIVISGGGDDRAFREISRAFSAEVVDLPLGRLKGEGFTMYSAWQLRTDVGGPISAAGVIVGTIQEHGKGRLILLADNGFLLSANIETETTSDAGNQQFLRGLVANR